MSKLKLTFGSWDYDRILPLAKGIVQADGIELNCLTMPPEETFFRMMRHQEFDVAECSFGSFLVAKDKGYPNLVGIPVFPSRFFRHCNIFVNAHAGIERPQDLKGKRVGLPEWQLTANLWMRGLLQDEYGLAPGEMEWFVGGQEAPGRVEKVKLDLPPSIRIHQIGPEQTLNQMLEDGEIDAFLGPRTPNSFMKGSPNVRRLFPDYKAAEQDYFRRTGIFPIMHLIAIRGDVYEQNPWVAYNLVKAFHEAKQVFMEGVVITAANKVTLPWFHHELEQTKALMGEDFWPYGVDRNRAAIEAVTNYAHQQGLTKRKIGIEELFAPSTYEDYVI